MNPFIIHYGSVPMDQELKKISCDPMCGFSVQSHVEDEVVNMALLHVQNIHPDQNYSKEDVKSMIKKA
jgi:predicted small metal-binding protein